MKKCMLAVFFLALASVAVGRADAAKIECPETVGVTETPHPDREKEWRPLTNSGGAGEAHHFTDVYFTFEPPFDGANFGPSREIRDKNHKVDIYNFPPPDLHPIWVACEYIGTYIVLAEPVTGPHRQCKVTYDPIYDFARPKEVDCY
jgi:hypothetical protein